MRSVLCEGFSAVKCEIMWFEIRVLIIPQKITNRDFARNFFEHHKKIT